jgi:phosphopantetheinyl transferase
MLSLTVAPVETVAGVDIEPTGELPGWLGDDERRRLATLAGPARQAFLASRALTRQLLADATGLDASRWRLSAPAGRGAEASLFDDEAPAAQATGQPGTEAAGLPGTPAEHAPPRVSLAHRLGWVVAAVADGDVGVDIECERPVRSAAVERAALMLTADEIAAWRRLPEAEREPALLCAWVAKEAWYKAVPAGTAPWDFRRVAARPSRPGEANVRVWSARPLWVALCRDDAAALAAVRCDGLPEGATVAESWWRVHRVAP